MAGFINIGFGNIVNRDKIVAVVSPDAAPVKRMVQQGKEEKIVIDATQGRRTKAVLVTSERHEKYIHRLINPFHWLKKRCQHAHAASPLIDLIILLRFCLPLPILFQELLLPQLLLHLQCPG